MKTHWTLGILMLSVLFVITISKHDAEGNWSRRADMPTPRRVLSVSVVDGKIYAIGGENMQQGKFGALSLPTVEMYDPKTDTWTQKADMPTPRSALATSVVGGKIYAVGGALVEKIKKPIGFTYKITEYPIVEMYDPKTDTWTQKADMPTPRYTLATSVVGGKIYAIGGSRSSKRLKTVEVYDPAIDIWRESQSLRNARGGLATVVVDAVIYAIGGMGWPPIANNPGPYLASVEAFNPKATQALWREKAEMPTPRSNLTVSVINENIYAIGGGLRENGPFMFISKIERYDTQTDTWRQLSDMPVGKLGHAAGVINGQIYILGGRRADHNGDLSTVEVYDPGEVSQSVTPTGKLLKTWGEAKKVK